MSELFDEEDTNLYGAANKVAVIIARGGGEYIDWTDENKVRIFWNNPNNMSLLQVEEVGRRFICSKHERELGSSWESKHWYHFKTKVYQGKNKNKHES